MDIRAFIRSHPKQIFGHEFVNESLNVKTELRIFTNNPLEQLLRLLKRDSVDVFLDEIQRFRQSYSWYTLSLERCLLHISLARRHMLEIKNQSRNMPFSQRQRALNKKYINDSLYLELDFQNLIIHSCLLLNRSLAIVRMLFGGSNLPSFTSFSKHKEFFRGKEIKNNSKLKTYSEYIKHNTDWFDIPLLILRDKYLMHSVEKHMAYLGWPDSHFWNLELVVLLPDEGVSLNKFKVIRFNPRRLARDIQSHFRWLLNFAKSN